MGKESVRKKAIRALKAEQKSDNTEAAHSNADDILCDLLESLGYKDVVAEYQEVYKWYA